jgi:hypothetical protein
VTQDRALFVVYDLHFDIIVHLKASTFWNYASHLLELLARAYLAFPVITNTRGTIFIDTSKSRQPGSHPLVKPALEQIIRGKVLVLIAREIGFCSLLPIETKGF